MSRKTEVPKAHKTCHNCDYLKAHINSRKEDYFGGWYCSNPESRHFERDRENIQTGCRKFVREREFIIPAPIVRRTTSG